MNYRLKKEAVPFINEKYATAIKPFEDWDKLGIDKNALEEVEDAYLMFGHVNDREKYSSSSLSGWSDKEGSHFHFTVHFPSTKFGEHDKFSNGKPVRELMNRIQNQVNYFMQDYYEKS